MRIIRAIRFIRGSFVWVATEGQLRIRDCVDVMGGNTIAFG